MLVQVQQDINCRKCNCSNLTVFFIECQCLMSGANLPLFPFLPQLPAVPSSRLPSLPPASWPPLFPLKWCSGTRRRCPSSYSCESPSGASPTTKRTFACTAVSPMAVQMSSKKERVSTGDGLSRVCCKLVCLSLLFLEIVTL